MPALTKMEDTARGRGVSSQTSHGEIGSFRHVSRQKKDFEFRV